MRLIDAEALIERYGEPCHSFADIIEDMPTIDAAPVVRGKWLDLCRGKMRVCSFCKHDFENTCNDIDAEWTFCPSCGAKMDEKED